MIRSDLILFLIDLFQRTSTRKYFNFYKTTLKWNRDQVKQYQLKKIKDLISYAQKKVPYYNNILGSQNFDERDIKSLDDLKHLPILTREKIQKHLKDLISTDFKIEELEKSSSSGTTGVPIEFYKNKESLSSGIAAGYFAWNLSGWLPGFKTLHVWGNPTTVAYWNKKRSKLKRFIKNQKNLAATEFSDSKELEKIYCFVKAQNFDTIDGYTTAIFELAKYIEYNNLSSLDVKQVFTTAENLLYHQKKVIEENVGPVSDLYGCGEINGIAIQPIQEKKYFIIEPHVIVEVESTNEEYKNIIVTDLHNKAMPFIRYKVGDLIDGVYKPLPNDMPQFSFFNRIFGRESEVIELPNGKKLLPISTIGGTLFRKIGGIIKHKVIWDGKNMTFIFETSNEFNLERAKTMIEKEFSNYPVSVHIKLVDRIMPDKSGKYKYFEKLI